eukprot:2850547-Rhodomonas_salina.1
MERALAVPASPAAGGKDDAKQAENVQGSDTVWVGEGPQQSSAASETNTQSKDAPSTPQATPGAANTASTPQTVSSASNSKISGIGVQLCRRDGRMEVAGRFPPLIPLIQCDVRDRHGSFVRCQVWLLEGLQRPVER